MGVTRQLVELIKDSFERQEFPSVFTEASSSQGEKATHQDQIILEFSSYLCSCCLPKKKKVMICYCSVINFQIKVTVTEIFPFHF